MAATAIIKRQNIFFLIWLRLQLIVAESFRPVVVLRLLSKNMFKALSKCRVAHFGIYWREPCHLLLGSRLRFFCHLELMEHDFFEFHQLIWMFTDWFLMDKKLLISFLRASILTTILFGCPIQTENIAYSWRLNVMLSVFA